MKEFNEPVVFRDRVTFQTLPAEFQNKFKLNATPSVLNLKTIVAANIAPNNVTNFIGGSDSQRIHILGDGQTTLIYDPTLIVTNTGASKLLAANKVYNFTYINNIWYEDA